MPNRPMHFEIHASDPEQLIKFYTNVFGWEIKKWDSKEMEYWMVMTGKQEEPGISGGIIRRIGPAPKAGEGVKGYVCTMVVDDYDAYAAKILAAGGFESVPKAALAGMAWQGYYRDPDNNIFGLHQADKNAK